jgi:UDP-glucose 4-epimerase
MRILITGGWGFIGGRLAQYLKQAGYTVVLSSRDFHNVPEWLPNAEVICIDWGNTVSLELACEGVDVIVHTAGMNAQDCHADPVAANAVNGLATEKLINAAISKSVKRFIYLSTVHVYSKHLIGKITDSTIPINTHPYATSHITGEKATLMANQKGLIEGVVLRLSNTFGYPTHKNVNCWMLLVNDLCKQAVQKNHIQIKSSGLQYRDFITMHEVCRIIINILENKSIRGCFNLCSENAITVLSIGELVQKRCVIVLNTHPPLTTLPKQPKEKYEALSCEMTGLRKAGFRINTDFTAEIDALLLCCKKWFSN